MDKPLTASELLTVLGFERLGARERDKRVLWIRDCGARDILLVLPEGATRDEVAEAIYDAGGRDKRQELQGRFNDLLECLKHDRANPLWTEARELQRQRREERQKAASMPKEEP
jgi:hypothetical protein